MPHPTDPQPPAPQQDDGIVGMLYDRPIRGSFSVSYTEQVHDILVDEIQSGHWRVGERLPGISSMAEQCGLSRMPVQLALNQLAEEGYVRQEGRRGTFLASMFPQGRSPKGTIGLVLVRDFQYKGLPTSDVYHVPFLHDFHESAAHHGYLIETLFVDWYQDGRNINAPDGPFEGRVCGVFVTGSLNQAPSDGTDTRNGRVPMVFQGAPFNNMFLPLVRTDTYYGMCRITRRLIELGHKDIAVYCEPAYPTPAPEEVNRGHDAMLEANLLTPHRLAMAEAGLQVNEEAIESSRRLPCASLGAIREFLERFESATAIIGLRGSPPNLVAIAQMLGRSVPEDLTIVTGHTGPYPMDPTRPDAQITGPYYNYRPVIDQAFTILDELREKGRCSLMRAQVPPGWIEGATLAPPRKSGIVTTVGKTR